MPVRPSSTATQAPLPGELNLTTVHVDPKDAPGMEWLEAVTGRAGTSGVMTTKECAESMRMEPRAVLNLIACGQLETLRAGRRQSGDHRITVRSWLTHLYYGWSHRHAATNAQVQTLVLQLLNGLPTLLLKEVALKCTEIIKGRAEAAAALRAKSMVPPPANQVTADTSFP